MLGLEELEEWEGTGLNIVGTDQASGLRELMETELAK
jgi:hypothetical protein